MANSITLDLPAPGPYLFEIWNVTLDFKAMTYGEQVTSLPHEVILPEVVHDFLVRVDNLDGDSNGAIAKRRSGYLEGTDQSTSGTREGYLKGAQAGDRDGFVHAPEYQGGVPAHNYFGDF